MGVAVALEWMSWTRVPVAGECQLLLEMNQSLRSWGWMEETKAVDCLWVSPPECDNSRAPKVRGKAGVTGTISGGVCCQGGGWTLGTGSALPG